MHEQSLMADLMRKILSVSLANGGCKVAGLKVKLGALAHISPEHFMEHFVVNRSAHHSSCCVTCGWETHYCVRCREWPEHFKHT